MYKEIAFPARLCALRKWPHRVIILNRYTAGCDKVNCGYAAREGALGYDLGAPFLSGLYNLPRRGGHWPPTL